MKDFTAYTIMHIHCLGLNHQTANLAMRERIAFTDEKTKAALARLGCGFSEQLSQVSDMVILSTCNRVEIYAVSASPESKPLLAYLADIHDLSQAELAPHTYHHIDQQVVSHLFRVAAGLDSLVLGEPQILGQVTHALELARSQNTAGALLSRLFQAAISAGKRAHSETHISRSPASVSSLAATLAERTLPYLEEAQVVVIGAGEMAELAVEALRKRGVSRILVVNRTQAHARELAERWQAQVTTFENLRSALTSADIVISSTGAPHTIIQYALVAEVMQLRADRPLVAIDIAVPRDIDPTIGDLPGVCLYDMDNLNLHLEASLAERIQEVSKVEAILTEEENRFLEFLKTLEVLPLIADIHQQAEAIRRNVLKRSLRRLPDLSEEEKANLESMTRALVKRLLGAPIMRLRIEAQGPFGLEYAAVARSLFGLSTHEAHTSHPNSTPALMNSTPEL